jgi:hypothetical protein
MGVLLGAGIFVVVAELVAVGSVVAVELGVAEAVAFAGGRAVCFVTGEGAVIVMAVSCAVESGELHADINKNRTKIKRVVDFMGFFLPQSIVERIPNTSLF